MKCLIAIAVFIAFSAASGRAFDWPQWQGPERNAISKEKGLLQKWPGSGPPLAWRIKGLGGQVRAGGNSDPRQYGRRRSASTES